MDIHGIGLQALQPANINASEAAEKIVKDPASADGYVSLKLAERDAEAGVRLLQAADRMTGTLLDVLA